MDYSTQAGSAAARADPYDVVVHYFNHGDSFDHIFMDLKRAGYETGFSDGIGFKFSAEWIRPFNITNQVKPARVHVVIIGHKMIQLALGERNLKNILRSGETIIPVFVCDEPRWPPGFPVYDAAAPPAQSTYYPAARRAQPLSILAKCALAWAKFQNHCDGPLSCSWSIKTWEEIWGQLDKITGHHLAGYNE